MVDVEGLKRSVIEKQLATAECSADRAGELVFEEIIGRQFRPPAPDDIAALRALIGKAVDLVRGEVGESHAISKPVVNRQTPRITSIYRHWERYKQHLLKEKGWDPDTVTGIDLATTQIVARLPHPTANTTAACRGLVLGYVQSGKTANMLGVIAKAADLGWNMIIVLAGLTNVLRKQTQGRLEDDIYARAPQAWSRLTMRDTDFLDGRERSFPTLEQAVRLAVVKKNTAVLNRLKTRFKNTHDGDLHRLRVLVIDDECDQASVNASAKPEKISAINGAIRDILELLPHHAYVGYTATPFANVLIDPETPEDLYPRDFIISLPRPPQYFGTDRLFGRGMTDADELEHEEANGLDVVREVPEAEMAALSPPRRRRKKKGESLPPLKDAWTDLQMTDCLRKSIDWFLMATAIRELRGQHREHSSMLVHTAFQVQAHELVAGVIEEELASIRRQLPARDPKLLSRWEKLYEEERDRVAQPEPPLLRPEFDTLLGACEDLLGRDPESPGGVDLIVENGPSERRLSYKRVTDEDGNVWGRRYLVVGGMVLARGLTIEGLVSSYFLRTTKQYDTLMQMGRWFGYRGGYDDLQRMWMPEEVSERFQNLATVEAEIREDISSYSNADDEVVRTPMDFAVRIRQMPGMLITSRNKMRSASRVQVSWSGHHVQTRRFHHRNSTWLSQNRAAAEQLLNVAGEPRYVSGGRVWLSIDAEAVADFLGSYQIHEHHVDLAQEHLLAFVEKLAEEGIDQWNVALVTPERGERAVSPFKSGPLAEVRMVNRACYDELSNGMGANIKALMSRRDLLLDVVASPHELTERVDDSWARVKVARQNALGKVPLVVLYLIDPNSVPRGWAARSDEEKENLDRTSTGFRPLEAVAPIVGLGLVFPDLGTQGGQVYVSVNLPEPEPDELDDAADEEAEEDG